MMTEPLTEDKIIILTKDLKTAFYQEDVASAVQGLKEDLCCCGESRQNICRYCRTTDKWFVGVVRK